MRYIFQAIEVRDMIFREMFGNLPSYPKFVEIYKKIDENLFAVLSKENDYDKLLDEKLKSLLDGYYTGVIDDAAYVEHLNSLLKEIASYRKHSIIS